MKVFFSLDQIKAKDARFSFFYPTGFFYFKILYLEKTHICIDLLLMLNGLRKLENLLTLTTTTTPVKGAKINNLDLAIESLTLSGMFLV